MLFRFFALCITRPVRILLFLSPVILLDFILQFPVTYHNFAYFNHQPVDDNVDTLYRRPAAKSGDGDGGGESGAGAGGNEKSFWGSMKTFFQQKLKLLVNTVPAGSVGKPKQNDNAKLTVVISQFNRPSCLRKQLRILRRCAIVHSIYVNWFDKSNPIPVDPTRFMSGSADDDNTAPLEEEILEELETEPQIQFIPQSEWTAEELQKFEGRFQTFNKNGVADNSQSYSGGSGTNSGSMDQGKNYKTVQGGNTQKVSRYDAALKRVAPQYKLSDKFRPHPFFPTDAVFVTDVDMFYSCHALQFAYNVWSQYNLNEVRVEERILEDTKERVIEETDESQKISKDMSESRALPRGETNWNPFRSLQLANTTTAIAGHSRHRRKRRPYVGLQNSHGYLVPIQADQRYDRKWGDFSPFVVAVGFHPRYISRLDTYDWSLSYRKSSSFLHNTIFATKGAVLHRKLFNKYFSPKYKDLREYVDTSFNGADLLMSYILANEYGPHSFRALCPGERYHLATAETCAEDRRPSNVYVQSESKYMYDAESDMLMEYDSAGIAKARMSYSLAHKKRKSICRIFGAKAPSCSRYMYTLEQRTLAGERTGPITGDEKETSDKRFLQKFGEMAANMRATEEVEAETRMNTKQRRRGMEAREEASEMEISEEVSGTKLKTDERQDGDEVSDTDNSKKAADTDDSPKARPNEASKARPNSTKPRPSTGMDGQDVDEEDLKAMQNTVWNQYRGEATERPDIDSRTPSPYGWRSLDVNDKTENYFGTESLNDEGDNFVRSGIVRLLSSVRDVVSEGFKEIVFGPAFEAGYDEESTSLPAAKDLPHAFPEVVMLKTNSETESTGAKSIGQQRQWSNAPDKIVNGLPDARQLGVESFFASSSSLDQSLGHTFKTPPEDVREDEEDFALRNKISEFQTYYPNSLIWERQTRYYMDFWRWLDRTVYNLLNEMDCKSAPWRSVQAKEFFHMQRVH